ncbi:nucleotide-binding universal stress UspA family protein [Georgenia soli]|uniref:Nucleotide-binding universal stress UspA family protein n=2 Tax=Georgenia soli TaxID=638953 RepID=A0A2A9EMR1_9MICO|nr:nucleotide-binding universal stress UspA family protein [Georgenia soli]
MDVPSGAVVAGFDGSARSRRAVDWAAGEAERHGAPLLVVAAVRPPPMVEGGVSPVTEDDVLAPARREVEAEVARVRREHPGATVDGTAVTGSPAVVLVRASERAGLVVVGARGHGPFAGSLLGSVSQKVLAHAHGPVVVVDEEAPSQLPGPVVVGADPADPPLEALRYAFDEARRRGVGVVVVSAAERTRTAHPYSPRVSEFFASQAAEDQEALRRLVEEMARERGVEAEIRLLPGHPADAILGVAGTESFVVVGSRGHGGLAGLLLGSVSREVLLRAPVAAVVRVRDRDRAEE